MTVNKTHYLVFALLAFGWLGEAQATTISVTPATQDITAGSAISVNVMFSAAGSVTGLGAFDFNVNYDPTVLNFQGATYGNGLDVFGLGDIQSTTPSAGSVNLFEVSLDSSQDILANQVSDFRLATLTFNAVGAGNSPLSIGLNALSDVNGDALTAATVGANVNVAPVPLPAAAWLLGSGLLGLAGAAQRRKKVSV